MRNYLIEYSKNGAELTGETFTGTYAKLRERVVALRREGAKIQSVVDLKAGGLEAYRFAK